MMGEKYVMPPVLNYKVIHRQSSSMTPIVFILSPGADPAFDVFNLGEEMGFKPGQKLKYMALGQGTSNKFNKTKNILLCIYIYLCIYYVCIYIIYVNFV